MSSPPADRRQRLQQLVENSEYVGVRPKRVTEQRTINPADPKIKQDIIRMILQYLQEEGYAASFVTIQDETNVKLAEQRTQRAQLKRMRKAILDGDWVEVEKMCSKASLPNYKAFLYAAHRAQYLELIEGGESQKAFTHLTKRLKPLESVAPSPSDFRDLCYLLTCKSVQEVVRDWEGAVPARERLVEQYNSMLDLEAAEGGGTPLPEQRLLRLLQQAVAYQMEFSHYHPRAAATQVSTLLEDYACPLLPNAQDSLLPGDAGVKCLEWIGTKPLLASSGNDHVVRLWNVQARTCVAALDAHTSRVWQVAAMPSGHSFASASADGTVCLWNTQEVLSDAAAMASGVALSVPPRLVLRAHAGDVHTCRFHPTDQQLLLSAGYDKTVRLCDVATGTTLRTMHGHLRS